MRGWGTPQRWVASVCVQLDSFTIAVIWRINSDRARQVCRLLRRIGTGVPDAGERLYGRSRLFALGALWVFI